MPKLSLSLDKLKTSKLGKPGLGGLFYYLKSVSPFLVLVVMYLWINAGADHTISQRRLRIPRAFVELARPDAVPPPIEQALKEPEHTPPASSAAPSVEDANVLNPAPNPALIETGRFGPMPVVGQDGTLPWKYYAAPVVEVPAGTAKLSIIITGFGLNQAVLSLAQSALPKAISLSFSPYAISLNQQLQNTRKAGHEVFLDLPLQPLDAKSVDLGPHTLKSGATAAENLERLEWVLSRAPGYVGLVNMVGLKFVQYENIFRPIMKQIIDRGLLFVDNGRNLNSSASKLANQLGASPLNAMMVLDEELSKTAILKHLQEATSKAAEVSHYIVFAKAQPLTIRTIAEWASQVQGVTLVPATQVAAEKSK